MEEEEEEEEVEDKRLRLDPDDVDDTEEVLPSFLSPEPSFFNVLKF